MFRPTRCQHGSVEREERKKGPRSLGLPMVGRRHQWKAVASPGPGWGCQEIPHRICGARSSRRSSANHQQSLRTSEPPANDDQHALGALLSRGTASQSFVHTISSGIPVGSGGKRGPSTGVWVSAKRRRSLLVLSAEQVKMGLAGLELRDQLLVFLDGALGIRPGELVALRWLDCNFENLSFQPATLVLLASRWAPEVHKNGSIGHAVADASKPETCLAGVEVPESLQPTRGFHLSFGKTGGQKTARSGIRAQKEGPTCVPEDRHPRRGLAHFSTHGGNYAGGDGRTSAHHPRLLAA